MRALRGLLGGLGVGCGLWGLWLMRGFTRDQLVSMVEWLVGAVVLHDLVLAPIVVLLGVAASRVLPGHFRAATGAAFLVWATLTVTFVAVLSGQGGRPDNATILHRPYWLSWLVLTGVLAGSAYVASRRRRPVTATRPAESPPEA